MFQGCVEKDLPAFKDFCNKYNLSPDSADLKIHAWWRTEAGSDGSYPSEDFMNKSLYGERVEFSDNDIALAEREGYFNTVSFSDENEAKAYYRRLSSYYPKRAIGSYTDKDGKVVITLAKPIIPSNSKYKDYVLPTVGGTITTDRGTYTITKVDKRGHNQVVVQTNQGSLLLIREEGNPNKFYFTKSKQNAYDKPDLTHYPVTVKGTVPYYNEYQQTGKELSSFINQSGGAYGSDTYWGVAGEKYGVHSNHWEGLTSSTPNGNKKISPEDHAEGKQKVTEAAHQMGRLDPRYSVKDERLIRNWAQVKYADAVFAIGSLIEVGERVYPDRPKDTRTATIKQVAGGTGYAVQMAINEGKPVHVFDDRVGKWFTYNSNTNEWVTEDTPVLTPNFAGIGTRGNEKTADGKPDINAVQKKAIDEVYAKTVNSLSSTAQSTQTTSNSQPSTTQTIEEAGHKIATSEEQMDQYYNEVMEQINNDVVAFRKTHSEGWEIGYHGGPYWVNPDKSKQYSGEFRDPGMKRVAESMGARYDGELLFFVEGGVMLPTYGSARYAYSYGSDTPTIHVYGVKYTDENFRDRGIGEMGVKYEDFENNPNVVLIGHYKLPILQKQNTEKNGQRRIYSESLSRAIKNNWKGIGNQRVQGISEQEMDGEGSNTNQSQGSSRVLDDVIKEASKSLDAELDSRGIVATKQPIKLAGAEEFHKAISEESRKNPDGFMVDVHDTADYENCLCLLTEDGKSGIAITQEGDIISVFSSVKGDSRLDKLMFMAIAAGGKKLDCFYLDRLNSLPYLYSRFGFKVAATTPFNEIYAPEGYKEWKVNNPTTEVLGVAAMYLGDQSPIDTYSKSRDPEIENAKVFTGEEGYNNALNERDKVITTMEHIRQQHQQTQQMGKESKKEKENQEFIDSNVALDRGLTNLQTSEVITATESREMAVQMVNWISDQITAIQNGDSEVIEKYKDLLSDLDTTTAERVDIARAIGPSKLVEDCKESFLKALSSKGITFKEAQQINVISNNWSALIHLAESTFMENERFSITSNGVIVEDTNVDADNFNESRKTEEVQENQGSAQENWQIEARTREILQNATAKVRDALRQCYILDSNGNKQTTKFGINARVEIHDATSSILRWTQGANDLDEMIDALESKVKSSPWVQQIIDRLKDRSGKESDFQSQFFVAFCQRAQLYSVVKAERDNNGNVTFKSIIVNRSPALNEAVKSVVNQFKIGEHPLFTSKGVNTTSLKQLTEAKDALTGKTDDLGTKEEVDKMLTFVFHTLGYYISEEDVAAATVDEDNIVKMVGALEYIVSDLTIHKDDSNYQPFTFKADGNIVGNLRKMLEPITDKLEDTAISSFYEDGKMYQTYTLPSYMTNLMAKFHHKDQSKFEEFIEKQYGSSEWFKEQTGDISTGWRNVWLSRMIKDPNARNLFEHKVQLSFNKTAYMTEMGDLQYTMSILSEYFSEAVTNGKSEAPAWFRVPMLSNKSSSEYIKFYKYVGDRYKSSIARGMTEIMFQEIARIRTTRMRNLNKGDKGFIKNWDEKGREFNLLTFLKDYLAEDNTSEFGTLLKKAVSKEGITDEETATLTIKAKKIILDEMQKKANSILEQYKRDGIVEAAKNIEHIGNSEAEILDNLENFIWNDTFAAMNILELTITDPAYYDGAVDLQKRFAQIHAPGSRPNVLATDDKGKPVADKYSRTIILNDFAGLRSNIIENIEIVFDRKIQNSTGAEKELYKKMKKDIIKQFEDINLTDAQAFNSPTSYRKKAILFGRWNAEKERIYQKLMRKEVPSITELQTAFGEVLKPFVYTQTVEKVGKEGSPIQNIPVPFQNKNSEYLLIMADAILRGENTGKPNLLRAIYDVMEDSAKNNPTKGIDTVQFDSAVKSGLHDPIDLNSFKDDPRGETLAREHILNSIYESDRTTGERGTTYKSSVRLIEWMDYGIQQEVPQHFTDHEQAHGSQIRAITVSELTPGIKLKLEGKEVSPEEFAKEYEETIAKNIEESIKELEKEFDLTGTRKERNIAIAKILRREMASSSRYGIDLRQACLLNADGEFNIPLGDPIQAKRIEQLLNSVVKNRVNKQTIAGGPVVQVSNFGTSEELNIRFKDKSDPTGKTLLLTRNEWEDAKSKGTRTEESFEKYKEENQGGIAYFEVYAPVPSNKLFERYIKEDGTIDIESIETLDPDLLKMVGYRIPTEDKYSCAPLKIVGFLPALAGDGIMLPAEITSISGSDFDVDKMYVMLKEFFVQEIRSNIHEDLYNELVKSQEKPITQETKKALNDLINQFLDRPFDREYLINQKTADGYLTMTKGAYNKLLKAYRKARRNPKNLEVKWPTEGRSYRNNKIVDMTYEVLTHEDSADKILNPGGFEPQKRLGYIVAAMKVTGMGWDKLKNMSLKELKKLSSIDQNLAFIDTHVQFYKQNSAAAALIGMFAVHKVAHAFIERDPLYIDFEKASEMDVPMRLGNTILGDMVKIDPTRDTNQALIGKSLGSLVASAADAAKDPVLNLMNINKDTANILNTAIRLGVPFEDAALLLSQNCMTFILNELNQRRLRNEPASLQGVIYERLSDLKEKHGMNNKESYNALLRTGISKDQLIDGVTSTDENIEMKALSFIQALLKLNNELKGVTLATRFNSISNAAGPLIVDNLIMEKKMKEFSKHIKMYNTATQHYDDLEKGILSVLELHPILEQFSMGLTKASEIMRDMPLYSYDFMNIIETLSTLKVENIIKNRETLSKFADFYNSYLLIANDVIDPGDCSYYINDFPKEFFYKENYKEKYRGNPLIDAIKLNIDSTSKLATISVDITGLNNNQKDVLMSGFIDIVSKDPDLAIKLFKYNFFRGGIGFTPKTFMSLTPLLLKRAIDGYNDSFLSTISSDPEEVTDLFIRNNWRDSDFVKFISPAHPGKNEKGEDVEIPNFKLNADGGITIEDKTLFSNYSEQKYVRTRIGGVDKLYKQVYANDKSNTLVYTEVQPLGGNNSYLEFTDIPIKITSTASETINGNGIRKGTESREDPYNEPIELTESMVQGAFILAGLTKEVAANKIEYVRNESEERRTELKPVIIDILKNHLPKLGINLNEKQIEEGLKKLNLCS